MRVETMGMEEVTREITWSEKKTKGQNTGETSTLWKQVERRVSEGNWEGIVRVEGNQRISSRQLVRVRGSRHITSDEVSVLCVRVNNKVISDPGENIFSEMGVKPREQQDED